LVFLSSLRVWGNFWLTNTVLSISTYQSKNFFAALDDSDDEGAGKPAVKVEAAKPKKPAAAKPAPVAEPSKPDERYVCLFDSELNKSNQMRRDYKCVFQLAHKVPAVAHTDFFNGLRSISVTIVIYSTNCLPYHIRC
jgi:hypothetical protein